MTPITESNLSLQLRDLLRLLDQIQIVESLRTPQLPKLLQELRIHGGEQAAALLQILYIHLCVTRMFRIQLCLRGHC